MKVCHRCNAANAANARYCQNCGYELPKPEPVATIEPEPKGNKSKNRKKPIAIVVSIIALIAMSFAVQKLVEVGAGKYFSSIKGKLIDKALMQTASEINKSCPFMVDAETRLDNVLAVQHSLQYNYTLIHLEKAAIDTLMVKDVLQPGIVNNIKSSPQMKELRDRKISFRYFYKDKNGVYLFQVLVSPEQYEDSDNS